jgi:hypothetical protein
MRMDLYFKSATVIAITGYFYSSDFANVAGMTDNSSHLLTVGIHQLDTTFMVLDVHSPSHIFVGDSDGSQLLTFHCFSENWPSLNFHPVYSDFSYVISI